MGGGRGAIIGGAEGGMGTTLILGAWMMGGIGAITEQGAVGPLMPLGAGA